ncbi:MAG: SDR family oxidoreductase [Verrucomicrobiae bacterium]|nr:SDR family oxidoreductase [Verrucomicrobiae bacterium]
MSYPLRVRSTAERDLADVIQWYHSHAEGVVDRTRFERGGPKKVWRKRDACDMMARHRGPDARTTMDPTNAVALVTGSSRGIGAATALALARAGAHVGVNYQSNAAAANSVVEQIKAIGRKAIAVKADVSDGDQVRGLVAHVVSALGPIDILINNAGGSIPGTIDQITEKAWWQGLAVHLDGPFHSTRAVVESMKQRRRGVIVNLSSVAALRGAPGNFAYQTVKAAIQGFTRGLARDLAEFGIRVNCISPGLIDTDFHAALPPEKKQLFCDLRVPLHRFGTPEEVADAILTLVQNDYVTGENLTVDGGLTMRIA